MNTMSNIWKFSYTLAAGMLLALTTGLRHIEQMHDRIFTLVGVMTACMVAGVYILRARSSSITAQQRKLYFIAVCLGIGDLSPYPLVMILAITMTAILLSDGVMTIPRAVDLSPTDRKASYWTLIFCTWSLTALSPPGAYNETMALTKLAIFSIVLLFFAQMLGNRASQKVLSSAEGHLNGWTITATVLGALLIGLLLHFSLTGFFLVTTLIITLSFHGRGNVDWSAGR